MAPLASLATPMFQQYVHFHRPLHPIPTVAHILKATFTTSH